MELYNSSFLFVSNDIFEIPFYQRAYVWEEVNWQKLIDGIIDNPKHFLGSIILQENNDKTFMIVDGQQRMTTICVLLYACMKIINEEKYNVRILPILFHSEAPNVPPIISEKNATLKVNHSIDHDYKKIITGKIPFDRNVYKRNYNLSNIVNCYNYFIGKFIDEEENEKEIITRDNAIRIVEFLLKTNTDRNKDGCFVRIALNSKDDDAQKIFDTINAEGVKLTCADIIKNNIFTKLKKSFCDEGMDDEKASDCAYRIYSDHWEKIFETKENMKYWKDEIVNFFGYVGSLCETYNRDKYNEDELHKAYNDYLSRLNSSNDIIDFIGYILNNAIIYKTYIKKTHDSISKICWPDYSNIDLSIHSDFNTFILEKCGMVTLTPYIMKVYYQYFEHIPLDNIDDDSILNIDKDKIIQLVNDLKKINSVCVRFYVCKKSYKKIKNLNKKIIELLQYNVIDFDKGMCSDAKGNDASINDDDFKEAMFHLAEDNSHGKLLLFLLELYRSSKDSTSTSKYLEYIYSLEHIIPQNYQSYWKIDEHPVYSLVTDLSQKSNLIKDSYLANQTRLQAIYALGNMLLLTGSQNSSEGNKYIDYKVDPSHDKKTGKKKDRWSSYRACNSLSITREVVNIYDENASSQDSKIKRHSNELWDERDVGSRTLNLIKELTEIFKL